MTTAKTDDGRRPPDEDARQPPAPKEPAHERQRQEHAESRGTPEKTVDKGTQRTHPTEDPDPGGSGD